MMSMPLFLLIVSIFYTIRSGLYNVVRDYEYLQKKVYLWSWDIASNALHT